MNRYNRRYNPLSPPFNNHQRPPNLFQELASLNYVNRHNQELVDRNRRFYQGLGRNNNLSHNPVNLQRFNNCNTNTRHGVRPTSPIQFHGIPHDQFQKGHGVYGRNMRGWTPSNKPAQLHMPNPLAGLRIPRLPSSHRRHPAPSSAPHASRQTQPPLKAPVSVVTYQTNSTDRSTTSKTMPKSQPLTNGGVSDESCVKQPKDTDEDSDNFLSNCSTLVLPVVGRVRVESASLMKDGVSGGLEYSGDVTEMVQDSSGTERENLELVLGDSEIDCDEQQTIKSEEPFETKCDVNSHEKTENGIRSISKDRELLSPGVMQTIKTEESFEPKCDVNGHEKTENGIKSITEDRELLSPDAMQTFQSEETFEIDVNGHEHGIKSISEDRELLSPGAMQTFTSEEIFQTKCDVNSHEKTENGMKSISGDRELLSPGAMQTFQSEETFETKCDVNGHGESESENGIKSVSEVRELLSPDAMHTFQSEETFETMCDVNSHEKTENRMKSVSEDRQLLSPNAMQILQREETFETKCDLNGHENTENGAKSIFEGCELLSCGAMETFKSQETCETKYDINSHEKTEYGMKSITEEGELLSSDAMQTFKSEETFQTKCDINALEKTENGMKSITEDRALLSPRAMQTFISEETFEIGANGHDKTENGVFVSEDCDNCLFNDCLINDDRFDTCTSESDEIWSHGGSIVFDDGFSESESDNLVIDEDVIEEEPRLIENDGEKEDDTQAEGTQAKMSDADCADMTKEASSVCADNVEHIAQCDFNQNASCPSSKHENTFATLVNSEASTDVSFDQSANILADEMKRGEDLLNNEPIEAIENNDVGSNSCNVNDDFDVDEIELELDAVESSLIVEEENEDVCDKGQVCLYNTLDVSENPARKYNVDEGSLVLPCESSEPEGQNTEDCLAKEDAFVGNKDDLLDFPVASDGPEVEDIDNGVAIPGNCGNQSSSQVSTDISQFSESSDSATGDNLFGERGTENSKSDCVSHFTEPNNSIHSVEVAMEMDKGDISGDQSMDAVDIDMCSHSSDGMMTDGSENSGSIPSLDEAYVQNLITKAQLLPDHENEKTNHDNSDFENDFPMSQAPSKKKDLDLIDMCSHSSDGMMTDGSENSGSIPSLDEAYVQNLITKAQLLPDHENEKTNHDISDFENDFPMSQAPSEKKDLDLKASERLSDVDQVDGDEDCSEHCQNPENHGDGSIGHGESRVLSSSPSCGSSDIMEEGDFKLCYDDDEQREEESLLDDAIPGCGDRGETFSPNSSLTIFNRNLDETDGRHWEENIAKGLQKLKTTLENFDERQDKSCKEDVIDHKECSGKNATDDGMVVEQNVGNVSSFNSGVSNMNDNVLEDDEKIDSDYETHRDGLVEKSPFVLLSEDNYLDQDDSGSSSNSEDGFHLELNMIDEPFPGRSTLTVCHDEDYASCKSSSSSTVCPEQDDISCRSSTSAECSEDVENGYSSNSTVTLRSLEQGDQSSEQSAVDSSTESLTVTLSSSTDPQTGKMKWVASKPLSKQRICDVEDKPTEGHVLRKSKATESSVTRSRKRRRMTPPSNPKVLRHSGVLSDVVKKPDEDNSKIEYHRLAENNSTKERWSIPMNYVAEKFTSTDHEDDDLHFGNTKELAELLKNVAKESHSQGKRSRSSPRKLFFAAKHGDVPQILALAASCNVNSTIPQENHKTAVHTAAAHGHVQALYVLYELGGNLSSLDCKLRPPLFDAVENNQIEVVKFLIAYKVNLTLRDSNGLTTLHIAAKKCYVKIINLLMATRKISIDEQDSGGWTALMCTAEEKHFDAAKCLLQWGASVHILDNEVNTCLHWAAFSGSTDIMELLLDAKVDIDSRNKFGATALHISTRERKLNNILVLEKYGPNLEIEDSEHRRAIQLAPLSSRCYTQLDRMEKFSAYRKCTMTERLITDDISRGQEFRPIPCVNNVDQEDLPKNFVYVHRSCEGPNISFDRISMTGCDCSDGCFNERSCQCAQLSARKRFWYNEGGLISCDIFREDRPLVYECNMKCKCWSSCSQRVVQRGMNVSLQLYKTKHKGWAVRTLALIPKGAFVCEYVGEILTDEEADKRDDDCYLFDLDVKGNSDLFCLDAKFYGNISRFVNHSCDPNVLPVRVFTDHQVKSCPRIAFFASREIHPYEEVCSDYGERFWKIKKSEFNCACNTLICRYKGPVG